MPCRRFPKRTEAKTYYIFSMPIQPGSKKKAAVPRRPKEITATKTKRGPYKKSNSPLTKKIVVRLDPLAHELLSILARLLPLKDTSALCD